MTRYLYITFLDKLSDDDITLMFHEVTEDIFFISNQQAILKSNKTLLDIKDEINLTNPDAPNYIILNISNLSNFEIYHEDNPEFERFVAEISTKTPSQEEIDSILDRINKHGKENLSQWELQILNYFSQEVGS